MTGWIERLPRAAFRGEEFLAESHEAKGGRRLVVHEYPGGDVPSVEDLGLAAWDWRLNAYFIGPQYDLARNRFLEQLAQPGPEWLTHPWLGLLWVRAKSWSVHESTDKGGYCTVAVDFVPGGDSVQPLLDTGDQAASSIEAFADAAQFDFSLDALSEISLNAVIAFVHQKLEVLRQVIALATLPLTWASRIRNVIDGIRGDLATLLAMPAAYAAAWRGLAHELSGGSSASRGLALSATRSTMPNQQSQPGQPGQSNAPGASTGVAGLWRLPPLVQSIDRTQQQPMQGTGMDAAVGSRAAGAMGLDDKARVRIAARFASAALAPIAGQGGGAEGDGSTADVPGWAQADGPTRRALEQVNALAARLLVSAAAQVALAQYQAAQQRDTALHSAITAIDALLPTLPDAVFHAAAAARTALIEALLAQDLRPAATRTIAAPLPAVVLAHRLGVDAAAFMDRNAVRHPLFVQGQVYG